MAPRSRRRRVVQRVNMSMEVQASLYAPPPLPAVRMPDGARINRYLDIVADQIGDTSPQLQSALACARPVLLFLFRVTVCVAPLYWWLYSWAYRLYLILPKNVVTMIFGAALCFFGGTCAAAGAQTHSDRGCTMPVCAALHSHTASVRVHLRLHALVDARAGTPSALRRSRRFARWVGGAALTTPCTSSRRCRLCRRRATPTTRSMRTTTACSMWTKSRRRSWRSARCRSQCARSTTPSGCSMPSAGCGRALADVDPTRPLYCRAAMPTRAAVPR